MSKRKSIWNKGDALLLEKSNNLDDVNYGRLFFLLSNLALNRFTWHNLPKGMESRHIEKALFEHGQCAFYDNSNYGLICLPCSNSDNRNVYGDPTHIVVNGIGFSEELQVNDVVRILNNDTCIPTMFHVNYYTNKIWEIDRAMRKNLKQQRRPYIVATTKENELTMKNIMKDIEQDVDEIYVDNKLANGGDVGAHVLNTNAPYLIDKYQQHKNDLWCEFLTIMGLNNSNANNSKKERLLVDEVNINNGEILMNLEVDFKNRMKACEEINKRFDLDISVSKNILTISKDFTEGDDNGEIHD